MSKAKTLKRPLAMLLAVLMVVMLLPTMALAAEPNISIGVSGSTNTYAALKTGNATGFIYNICVVGTASETITVTASDVADSVETYKWTLIGDAATEGLTNLTNDNTASASLTLDATKLLTYNGSQQLQLVITGGTDAGTYNFRFQSTAGVTVAETGDGKFFIEDVNDVKVTSGQWGSTAVTGGTSGSGLTSGKQYYTNREGKLTAGDSSYDKRVRVTLVPDSSNYIKSVTVGGSPVEVLTSTTDPKFQYILLGDTGNGLDSKSYAVAITFAADYPTLTAVSSTNYTHTVFDPVKSMITDTYDVYYVKDKLDTTSNITLTADAAATLAQNENCTFAAGAAANTGTFTITNAASTSTTSVAATANMSLGAKDYTIRFIPVAAYTVTVTGNGTVAVKDNGTNNNSSSSTTNSFVGSLGDTVITLTPTAGNEVKSLTINGGQPVALTDGESGVKTYTLTGATSQVYTIAATFGAPDAVTFTLTAVDFSDSSIWPSATWGSALGTKLNSKTDLTYAAPDAQNKIVATGALDYVVWPEFNSTVPAEQSGYYAAFSIKLPDALKNVTPSASGTVLWIGADGEGQKTAGNSCFESKSGGGADKYLEIVLWRGEYGSGADYTFSIDWDGDGTTYSKVTYTIDFSAVTYNTTELDEQEVVAYYHLEESMPLATAELADGALTVTFPSTMPEDSLGAVAIALGTDVLGSDLASTKFKLSYADLSQQTPTNIPVTYSTTGAANSWGLIGQNSTFSSPAGNACILPAGYTVGGSENIGGWLVIFLTHDEWETDLYFTGNNGEKYTVALEVVIEDGTDPNPELPTAADFKTAVSTFMADKTTYGIPQAVTDNGLRFYQSGTENKTFVYYVGSTVPETLSISEVTGNKTTVGNDTVFTFALKEGATYQVIFQAVALYKIDFAAGTNGASVTIDDTSAQDATVTNASSDANTKYAIGFAGESTITISDTYAVKVDGTAVASPKNITAGSQEYTVAVSKTYMENFSVKVVYDETTYNANVPASYKNQYDYAQSAASLPWLVITWDSNIAGERTLTYTKDGSAGTFSISGTQAAGNHVITGSIGTGKYWMYEMDNTPSAPTVDSLGIADPYGAYEVTMTMNGETYTANATYTDPTDPTELTVTNVTATTPAYAEFYEITGGGDEDGEVGEDYAYDIYYGGMAASNSVVITFGGSATGDTVSATDGVTATTTGTANQFTITGFDDDDVITFTRGTATVKVRFYEVAKLSISTATIPDDAAVKYELINCANPGKNTTQPISVIAGTPVTRLLDTDSATPHADNLNYAGDTVKITITPVEGYTYEVTLKGVAMDSDEAEGHTYTFKTANAELYDVVVTFTADDTSAGYTVTYVFNDGVTDNMVYTGVPAGTVLQGMGADPVRTGYKFDGWYTDDETFQNQWTFNQDAVTGDTTLYAKWLLNTYTAVADGAADTTASTKITLTFDFPVVGLLLSDVSFTDTGSTGATKGTLSTSDGGTTYTLTLGGTIAQAGNVTVSVNKAGVESEAKTVALHKAPITYTAQADGWDGAATSTKIRLTFSEAVDLSSGATINFTDTDSTGATQGTLTPASGSNTVYDLSLTGTITKSGNVTISIGKTGIEAGNKTVGIVFYAAEVVTWTGLMADGVSNDKDSTKLTLVFDKDFTTDLEPSNVTVTGSGISITVNSNSGTAGYLQKTGPATYEITLGSVTWADGAEASVQVTHASLDSSPATKTVPVYKEKAQLVWSNATATAGSPTTEITLTFGSTVVLTADDVTLTGANLVSVKNNSNGDSTDTIWKLTIDTVTSTTVTVMLDLPGEKLDVDSKDVPVTKTALEISFTATAVGSTATTGIEIVYTKIPGVIIPELTSGVIGSLASGWSVTGNPVKTSETASEVTYFVPVSGENTGNATITITGNADLTYSNSTGQISLTASTADYFMTVRPTTSGQTTVTENTTVVVEFSIEVEASDEITALKLDLQDCLTANPSLTAVAFSHNLTKTDFDWLGGLDPNSNFNNVLSISQTASNTDGVIPDGTVTITVTFKVDSDTAGEVLQITGELELEDENDSDFNIDAETLILRVTGSKITALSDYESRINDDTIHNLNGDSTEARFIYVESSRTVAYVKSMFNETVKILKPTIDGSGLTTGYTELSSNTAIVGTGCVVVLGDELNPTDNADWIWVVVKGDTTGNGKIAAADYLRVCRDILRLQSTVNASNPVLSGVYLLGAKVNNPEATKLAAKDYLTICRHILRLGGINLDSYTTTP